MSYQKLFAVVAKPQDLPYDELYNEMKTQYELSGRIVRQAVPVFLKIAELAGLKEAGSVVARKRGPKTGKKEGKKAKQDGTPPRTLKQIDEFVASGFFSHPCSRRANGVEHPLGTQR